jgi:hypothetical protein
MLSPDPEHCTICYKALQETGRSSALSDSDSFLNDAPGDYTERFYPEDTPAGYGKAEMAEPQDTARARSARFW